MFSELRVEFTRMSADREFTDAELMPPPSEQPPMEVEAPENTLPAQDKRQRETNGTPIQQKHYAKPDQTGTNDQSEDAFCTDHYIVLTPLVGMGDVNKKEQNITILTAYSVTMSKIHAPGVDVPVLPRDAQGRNADGSRIAFYGLTLAEGTAAVEACPVFSSTFEGSAARLERLEAPAPPSAETLTTLPRKPTS